MTKEAALKGLKNFLEQIKKDPANKILQSRYITLLSELDDDEQKKTDLLNLANILVEDAPKSAMKYAYMVFRQDKKSLDALELVAFCLDKIGRYAKAEVIRIQLEKLKTVGAKESRKDVTDFLTKHDLLAINDKKMVDIFNPQPGIFALPEQNEVPSSEHGIKELEVFSQLSEIDLSEALKESPPKEDPISVSLPQKEPDPGEPLKCEPKENNKRDLAHLEGVAKESLEDSAILPVPDIFQTPSPLPEKNMVPKQGSQLARVGKKLEQEFKKANSAVSAPSPESSDLEIICDLFDFYWQRGFIGEAEDLLYRTSEFSGEEQWWKSRYSLLCRGKAALQAHLQDKSKDIINKPKPPSERSPLTEREFFAPLYEDMSLLATGKKELLTQIKKYPTEKPPDQTPSKFNKLTFPPLLLDQLISTVLSERDLVSENNPENKSSPAKFCWDICLGIWQGEGHADLERFLSETGLSFANEHFWGLYLDSLLAEGMARKALFEIRRVLREKSTLKWAQTAWQRLPPIWKQLKVIGFEWNENLGVDDLLKKLKDRPRPKISSLANI